MSTFFNTVLLIFLVIAVVFLLLYDDEVDHLSVFLSLFFKIDLLSHAPDSHSVSPLHCSVACSNIIIQIYYAFIYCCDENVDKYLKTAGKCELKGARMIYVILA